jgi:DNA modification methylase
MTRLSVSTWGMKEKDAMGIPWAVAVALRADGWYLRQEIIWRKTFGKPEPAKDRFPSRHEPIFLFSKNKRYYFDRASVPNWADSSVWEIPPTGHREHGAAFPPALIDPCILAGCPIGGVVLDPFGGSGTTGLVSSRLQRNAILLELNPAYAAMARARIDGDRGGLLDAMEAA